MRTAGPVFRYRLLLAVVIKCFDGSGDEIELICFFNLFFSVGKILCPETLKLTAFVSLFDGRCLAVREVVSPHALLLQFFVMLFVGLISFVIKTILDYLSTIERN